MVTAASQLIDGGPKYPQYVNQYRKYEKLWPVQQIEVRRTWRLHRRVVTTEIAAKGNGMSTAVVFRYTLRPLRFHSGMKSESSGGIA